MSIKKTNYVESYMKRQLELTFGTCLNGGETWHICTSSKASAEYGFILPIKT